MFDLASDKFNLADLGMGALYVGLVHLIPDDWMSWGAKVLFAMITAFCGGFFYHMGKALWTKVSKITVKTTKTTLVTETTVTNPKKVP